MKSITFVIVLGGGLLAATPLCAADAVIKAAPMKYEGANPTWPRLVKFPDAKVMARANKLFAAKEKEDRGMKAECYQMVKEAKQKTDADTYSVDISVSYLSAKFMTIRERTSSYCATAYPTNGALTPYTVELTGGTHLDWGNVFKPGFLPTEDEDDAKVSTLTKLYRANYKKTRNTPDDQECVEAVMDRDPFASVVFVYLDRGRGIVFEPEFPHVIAACADDFALSPAQAAPYLKNATLANDLKAMVKP